MIAAASRMPRCLGPSACARAISVWAVLKSSVNNAASASSRRVSAFGVKSDPRALNSGATSSARPLSSRNAHRMFQESSESGCANKTSACAIPSRWAAM